MLGRQRGRGRPLCGLRSQNPSGRESGKKPNWEILTDVFGPLRATRGNTQADPEDAKLKSAKEREGELQRIEGEEWVTRFFLPWLSQWGEERGKSIPAQLAT